MPCVKLFTYSKDYMDILKLAVSKPYGSNPSIKLVKKVIESDHLSILEHCNAVFDVECSVRVLGQLTRHRCLHYTVQSARGKQFDTFVQPGLFEESNLEYTIVGMPYYDMLADGSTLEDAAYYLPQGVKTTLVVSGNFRAWYEWLPKRLCKRAMPEHRKIAELVHEELKKAAPEVFDRNFMGCATCKEKSCKF